MASFGENLQREREMRGVTLEEISAATKISSRFLVAIEREEFGKLPGGIFTRSFVRAYARYLGLDEERVLAEYQLAAPPREDVDLRRIISSNPPSAHQGSRTPLLALAAAATLLGVGYALYRYSWRSMEVAPSASETVRVTAAPPQASPQAPPAPASSTATETPADTSLSSPAAGAPGAGASAAPTPTTPGAGTPASPRAAPAPQPSASSPAIPAQGGLVLQVDATERAWVAVEADGKTVLQRVMNPQDVQTLNARESFDVTTGNARGVILTLNGETLRPLGRHGEVKSVHLTRDDLKNTSP